MAKTVWFDMDGTIYDLYGIQYWLECLEERDADVFLKGQSMYKGYEIRRAIQVLIAHGWQVGVITWAPMGVTEDDPFFTAVKRAKQMWLSRHYPELLDNFYCLPYGRSKAVCACNHWSVRNGSAEDVQILVDDNMLVREDWTSNGWHGYYKTIDATNDYTKRLEGLVM